MKKLKNCKSNNLYLKILCKLSYVSELLYKKKTKLIHTFTSFSELEHDKQVHSAALLPTKFLQWL